MIRDLNVRFTDKLSLYSMRLQNQIRNVHAKFKRH